MSKEILIEPSKCIGCCSCALVCSVIYHNEFNLTKAYITIDRDDFNGQFYINFSSQCHKCGRCTDVCPTNCLYRTH